MVKCSQRRRKHLLTVVSCFLRLRASRVASRGHKEDSYEPSPCNGSPCRTLRATKRDRNALAWVLAGAGSIPVPHPGCGIRGTLRLEHPVGQCASPSALLGHRRCLQYFWAADTRRRATASRTRPFTRLPSPWWFLAHVLNVLGFLCIVLFGYLFPSGHLVPRWTRWVAVVALVY